MPIQTAEQAAKLATWAKGQSPDDPRVKQILTDLQEFRQQRTTGEFVTEEELPEAQAQGFVGPAPTQEQATAANRRMALTPKEQAEVANLEQLQRQNPAGAGAVQQQIDAIVARANDDHETLFSQAKSIGSITVGAGVPLAWAGAKSVAGGVAGLFQWGKDVFYDGETVMEATDNATDLMDSINSFAQIGPLTEEGGEVLNNLGEVMAQVEDKVEWLSTTLSMGNPVAATAIHTAIMGAPEILGLKPTAIRAATNVRRALQGRGSGWTGDLLAGPSKHTPMGARRRAEAIADDFLKNEGRDLIDRPTMIRFMQEHGLGDSGVGWREPVANAARRMAPEGRAAQLDEMVGTVRRLREESNARLDAAYAEAAKTKAWVKTGSITELGRNLEKALREGDAGMQVRGGFDFADGANEIVKRRLGELQNMDTFIPSRSLKAVEGQPFERVNFTELELFRRRLNNDLNGGNLSASEAKQLGIIKNQLDEFADHQFNNMLIKGDQAALSAWQRARGLAAEHARQFSADKTIRQLADVDATPEQVRNWILGASDALPPAQVGATVKRLGDLLGRDSNEMVGLRMEFTRGLMEPLLKAEPNYAQFVDGVDRFINRNPTLVRELGFDTSDQMLREIRTMRQYVNANLRNGADGFFASLNPYAILTRFSIGHGIARRGQMVKTATAGLHSMANLMFGGRKRAVWNDMLGVDGRRPLISKDSIPYAAAVTAEGARRLGIDWNEEREEQALNAGIQAAQRQQMAQQDPSFQPRVEGRQVVDQRIAATVGYKANNPTNMRPNGQQWMGQTGVVEAGNNGTFMRFETPVWGIRAAMRDLRTKINGRYNTIDKIVDRWASDAEATQFGTSSNAKYKEFLVNQTGLGLHQPLIWDEHVMMLVDAMIRKEIGHGANPYTQEQMLEAKSLVDADKQQG